MRAATLRYDNPKQKMSLLNLRVMDNLEDLRTNLNQFISDMNGGNPEPLTGSGNQLKKSIGRIIIRINSEILDLQQEYKKVKEGTALSTKGVNLEKNVKEKKEALEDALGSLEGRPDFVTKESMEKTVQMIKDNIATAEKVLKVPDEGDEVSESDINDAQKKASETIDEIVNSEEQAAEEMRCLTATLSTLASVSDVIEKDSPVNEDENVDFQRELEAIGKYQKERFFKMMKEIEVKMDFQISNLLVKWKEQKEILDYQALKEIRSEMEETHKKLRFMISEWDRRKLSDRLSDHLTDVMNAKFDEYIVEYRRMDEEKRTEAAVQRKRNHELEEYKREKKRPIPTWPQALPYTKFKPDLLSWDREHHLSSGSVKFGLLAEMMKSQGRITTYEQIQTRLGKNRNEVNIIAQIVTLLDAINEETVYNKLCAAWDDVTSLKKKKSQTL